MRFPTKLPVLSSNPISALPIGALKICELLAGFDIAALKEMLQKDPEGLLHLLQILPKQSQAGMACEELGLEVAKRKGKLAKAKLPPQKRGISDEALKLAEERLKLL